MIVRSEKLGDYEAIANVNRLAFGRDDEVSLVKALRDERQFTSEMSFVAEEDGEVVGHILFSNLSLVVDGKRVPAAALAPMAVSPEKQRQGVGSLLINEGLKRMSALGYEVLLVLGHTEYYPRFGFSLALGRKVASVYSGDHFMALELIPGVLPRNGVARVTYPKAFEGV